MLEKLETLTYILRILELLSSLLSSNNFFFFAMHVNEIEIVGTGKISITDAAKIIRFLQLLIW
jgi:hypothetical protein